MADVELVIKVPEESYNFLKSGYFIDDGTRSGKTILQHFCRAIYNGKPLPKGHGRLIDADALDIDNLNRAYDNNFELDFGRLYTADVIDMVANAPAIISASKESEE